MGDYVGSRAGDVGQCHLADLGVYILDSSAVAAHVEDIEVVEMRLVAAVIPFARPELGIGLALKYVAALNEGFTQADLVVADASTKIRVACRVRGIGLNHKLRLHPRLIGIVFRIQPVVDEDQLTVCFRLIPQPEFRIGPRSLKCHLLSAPAVESVA